MECILYEKLPVTVARQLMYDGFVPPERPKNVSVMFANIHKLMKTTETMHPEELVKMLNQVINIIFLSIHSSSWSRYNKDNDVASLSFPIGFPMVSCSCGA